MVRPALWGDAVSAVSLSERGVIMAILATLIETEETTLKEIIRNHQYHSMEARRYELRMIEVETARQQYKTLLQGLK